MFFLVNSYLSLYIAYDKLDVLCSTPVHWRNERGQKYCGGVKRGEKRVQSALNTLRSSGESREVILRMILRYVAAVRSTPSDAGERAL